MLNKAAGTTPPLPTGYFHASASDCWSSDSSGTIKWYDTHSCEVTGNKGKCGSKFLCKNNQHVYGPDMPTTKFSMNTGGC